jgi:hypothetical protein
MKDRNTERQQREAATNIQRTKFSVFKCKICYKMKSSYGKTLNLKVLRKTMIFPPKMSFQLKLKKVEAVTDVIST